MTSTSPETLASILEAVATREAGPICTDSLRLAVVRNYTVETMVPFLKHHCFQASLQPEIHVGDYDNIAQEILSPDSGVYRHQPDLILISWLLEHLDPNCARSNWSESVVADFIQMVLDAVVERSRALIAVSTLLPPLHSEASFGAGLREDHRVTRVQALNRRIRAFATAHPHQVFVVDTERLVRMVGEERAIDQRFWHMYRSPFRKEFLVHYADQVVRIGRALKGRARKVLILDCDNTLWGGVVGEDGLEGIALDPYEYPGRCFVAFQQSVLNLIDQGVVVALCSKNNEEDVWEVLDRHPHCLLKREHLATWRVNWRPKSENVLDLARELNLGLDSMVFVDDSSTECEIVRQQVPGVTVLQAPANVFELPQLLFRDGLFDVLSVSEEDRGRTAMYVAERQRDQVRLSATSGADFLASLELKATIHQALATELSRVAQLVSKTNQFNLTTRRHSEARVRELASSPDSAIFTLSASDRFGDLGLVGVLIAERDGHVGTVESLLLSCRALGRQLEVLLVHRALLELERLWAVTEWRASYARTAKNAQVEHFWEAIGFAVVPGSSEPVQYRLPVSARQAPPLQFITLSE